MPWKEWLSIVWRCLKSHLAKLTSGGKNIFLHKKRIKDKYLLVIIIQIFSSNGKKNVVVFRYQPRNCFSMWSEDCNDLCIVLSQTDLPTGPYFSSCWEMYFHLFVFHFISFLPSSFLPFFLTSEVAILLLLARCLL